MIADRLGLLHEVGRRRRGGDAHVTDWGPSGGRVGQYALDVTADEAALPCCAGREWVCLSEESGFEPGTTGEVVVIDPIDGSTNASRGIPWFATSLCLVDARRSGSGARRQPGQRTCDTRPSVGEERGAVSAACSPRAAPSLSEAIVVVSAVPPPDVGWAQFRAFGACALDLCALADGAVDGYVDFGTDQHGVWDYLGGWLDLS